MAGSSSSSMPSHGWLVGGQDASVLSSSDGGIHWHRMAKLRPADGTHLELGDIYFADRLRGWVIGSYKRGSQNWGYFAETSDGGSHWRPVTLPASLRGTGVQIGSVTSLGPNHVWAVTEDGLILSSQRSVQESP